MMDVEKLIRRLRNDADAYRNGETLGRAFADQEDVLDNAATALSTLQTENKKLRAEVESLKKGYCAGCSIPAVKAEQIRDLTDAPKLRAELESVKRERDAAVKTIFQWTGCPECKYWDSADEWCEKHDREADSCSGCESPEWRGQKED